jgi:hypothetical protein
MALRSRQRRRDEARVRILIAGLPPVDAEVAKSVAGAVELRLGRDAPIPARMLHRLVGDLVPVSLPGDRVTVRLLAVPDPDGRVDASRLYAIAFAPEPERTPVQRRRHVRVPVIRPVTLVPVRFQVGWLDGITRDVSAGGALVSGTGPLRDGERLRARLQLDDEVVLDLPSRVARTTSSGHHALMLERLDGRDHDRLARWVRQQELELIRRLQRY